MDYLKAVEYYNKGIVTQHEVVFNVFLAVTPENVRLVLATLPPDMREFVIDRARELEGVESVRSFRIEATIYPKDYDWDAHHKREEEKSKAYCRGAEIIREYTKL
jgi:hypothetical protein